MPAAAAERRHRGANSGIGGDGIDGSGSVIDGVGGIGAVGGSGVDGGGGGHAVITRSWSDGRTTVTKSIRGREAGIPVRSGGDATITRSVGGGVTVTGSSGCGGGGGKVGTGSNSKIFVKGKRVGGGSFFRTKNITVGRSRFDGGAGVSKCGNSG